MCSEELALKRQDTVIFAPDFIEYAFVGVSLSDAKCMGWDYSNYHPSDLIILALVKLLVIVPLFNAPKKHVLKQAVICAALGRLQWS